jgi:hypothetical protein
VRVLAALVLLHGVVTRGPTTPVCQVGVPCSKPAPGVVLVFSRAGVVVARVRSGVRGRYTVHLRTGTYDVRLATAPTIGRGLAPRRVVVPLAEQAHVDFEIDTGIR